MQRNVYRGALKLAGPVFGKSDCPRHMSSAAVAASRRQAANPSKSVAQCNSRCKHVGGREEWNLFPPHIPPAANDRQQQPAGKNATGLQGRVAENTAWLSHVVAPIHQQHQEL